MIYRTLRVTTLAALGLAALGVACPRPAFAQDIPSANGNPFDIDTLTGEVGDGGQDAFDDYGGLYLRVQTLSGTLLTDLDSEDNELGSFGSGDFGLVSSDGGRGFTSTSSVERAGISVTRRLFSPDGTDYLRYFDTFTNTTGEALNISVGWGGNLGSDSSTTLAFTSSGASDINGTPFFSRNDVFAGTIENNDGDPNGQTDDPPVAYLFRDTSDPTFFGVGSTESGDDNPFTRPLYPSFGDDGLTYLFRLTVAPGDSASLVYFLYRGISEADDDPLTGGPPPPPGSETARARQIIAGLSANPNFDGLSFEERARVRNFDARGSIIPEPGTIALAITALLPLTGAVVRRRRKASAV